MKREKALLRSKGTTGPVLEGVATGRGELAGGVAGAGVDTLFEDG